jgi:hypothetical protein
MGSWREAGIACGVPYVLQTQGKIERWHQTAAAPRHQEGQKIGNSKNA